MKEALVRALVRSPLQVAMEAWNRRKLRVLAFHRVDDPPRFRVLMEILRAEYTPVALDAVIDHVDGRRELPDRPVLVTFDDGHRSVLEDGLSILKEFEIPAMVFPVAGLVGTDQPPWWEEAEAMSGWDSAGLIRELKRLPDRDRRERIDELRRRGTPSQTRSPQLCSEELRALDESGVEVGNHTWTHPILPRCEPEIVEQEIVRAHFLLAETLGRRPRAFAYPNGDYSERAAEVLASLGYSIAFLFDHRLTTVQWERRLNLSRLRVSADGSRDDFELRLSGLHPMLYQVRRHLRLV